MAAEQFLAWELEELDYEYDEEDVKAMFEKNRKMIEEDAKKMLEQQESLERYNEAEREKAIAQAKGGSEVAERTKEEMLQWERSSSSSSTTAEDEGISFSFDENANEDTNSLEKSPPVLEKATVVEVAVDKEQDKGQDQDGNKEQDKAQDQDMNKEQDKGQDQGKEILGAEGMEQGDDNLPLLEKFDDEAGKMPNLKSHGNEHVDEVEPKIPRLVPIRPVKPNRYRDDNRRYGRPPKLTPYFME